MTGEPTALPAPPPAEAVPATTLSLVLGSGGDDGDDGSDGGGPGRRRPAPGRPPSAPPDWWPEFEREFADHVAAKSRNRGIETGAR